MLSVIWFTVAVLITQSSLAFLFSCTTVDLKCCPHIISFKKSKTLLCEHQHWTRPLSLSFQHQRAKKNKTNLFKHADNLLLNKKRYWFVWGNFSKVCVTVANPGDIQFDPDVNVQSASSNCRIWNIFSMKNESLHRYHPWPAQRSDKQKTHFIYIVVLMIYIVYISLSEPSRTDVRSSHWNVHVWHFAVSFGYCHSCLCH